MMVGKVNIENKITMPTVFIVTHAKENKHSLSFARTMVLTLFKRVNK